MLARELSQQSFKTWFALVPCLAIDDSGIVLGVPDSYYGQWLKDHYHELITSAIKEAIGQQLRIEYRVVPSFKTFLHPSESKIDAVARAKVVSEISNNELNDKYTFDNFVIGPGNRFAHAAAVAVTEAPARQYNPLFIYGPTGLGKTHLLQAIAHEIRKKQPNDRIRYISSEKFTNELITAIQTRTTQQFRNRYRTLDLLLIDDIHFIAEKESTQEEFFHTFNTLYDAHKQIIVTSDRPPKEIPGLEERLVSRFAWGLITDVQPPDFETRVAILKKKMEKETLVVPDEVTYFIAEKIKSNIRELEGALIRVLAYCTLTRTEPTLKTVQDVLKDSFREEEQKISIEKIQRIVAFYFNLKVSDLRAKRRSRSVATPRQIAMYLIRILTDHSLPEIGEYFGGRDHTTVLHAFNKINREILKDLKLKKTLDEIKDLLKKGE
ncbi:MAG: chromosomal replication initiator protein DnaA [Candidatus Omnitrophica bacterium]|nr:chromosomal replication initiator protein DnaA [Candidatus Omnitrophota bacterium]